MMVINGRRSAVTWLDTYTTGIELKCNLSSPPIFPISRPSTESASPWPRSLADLADVQVMHYYLFLARDFLSFLSSKRQPPRSNLRPPANHPTLLQLHNPPKRLLRLPDLPTKLVRPRKRQPSLRIIPPDSQSRETGQKHVRALASSEAVEFRRRGRFAGGGGDSWGELSSRGWCWCWCWGDCGGCCLVKGVGG